MPVDRGALDAQLREIGEGERWWEQREFRELPYLLLPGERIRGLALGRLLGRRGPRVGLRRRWLLVATDQRLICLRHERFARSQVDLRWEQIVRLRQSSGFGSYRLVLWTAERRYRIQVARDDAPRFVGAIEPLIPRAVPHHPGPELEALRWIPGMATVAALPPFSGIVTRMAMLSPPDYATRERVERLEGTVERLQGEMEALRHQVGFLEELLERRAAEALALRGPEEP